MKTMKTITKAIKRFFTFENHATNLDWRFFTLLLVVILSSCGNTFYLTNYTNGQILLPDFAHNDTLIVVNANRLNSLFSGATVEDITDLSDILYEGAVPINKNQNQ